MKTSLKTAIKVGVFALLAIAVIFAIVPGLQNSESGKDRRTAAAWTDVTIDNFIPEVILSDRPTIVAILYAQGNASEVMEPIYDEIRKEFPQIKFVRLMVVEENLPLVKAIGLEPDFQPALIVLNHAFSEKPAFLPGVFTKDMLIQKLLPLTFAQTLKPGKGLGESLIGGSPTEGDVKPEPQPNK